MKILWFCNNLVNLNPGISRGSWMQCLEAELSTDSGIELYVASRSSSKEIKKISRGGVTYYLIPDKRKKIQKRIDLLFGFDPIGTRIEYYLNIIDNVKPDVIHIFGTEMDYGLITELTRIPVVIHIQGILKPYYFHLMNLKIPFIKKLFLNSILDWITGTTFGNSFTIWKRRVSIEESIYKSAKYFMGRTDWDKQLTHLFSPQAKYFHCDEMLRKIFINNKWYGNASENFSIVSILSSPLYKGHETIVSTCKILMDSGFTNFIWHVVGVQQDTHCYKLFYESAMKVMSDNIKLSGELDSDALLTLLIGANVYIHPSHIENSSNSICEAMTLGMPVIALNVGGNPSLIEHGVDGVLVSDNDPYMLASAIIDVRKNPDKYSSMGFRARHRSTVRHDPNRIVKQLKSIYLDILSSNTP